MVGCDVETWAWSSDIGLVVWSNKLVISVAGCWDLVTTLAVSWLAVLGVVVWVLCGHWLCRLVVGVESALCSRTWTLARLLSSDTSPFCVDGRAVDASHVHDEWEGICARDERRNDDALHDCRCLALGMTEKMSAENE